MHDEKNGRWVLTFGDEEEGLRVGIAIPGSRTVFQSRNQVHVRYNVIGSPSVCRLSSVWTLVHPTQAIEIFGNISTPCGTLAIQSMTFV